MATKSQPTPGPWDIDCAYEPNPNHDYTCRFVIVNGPHNPGRSADVWENNANERLIKAAPELFSALYDMIASGAFRPKFPSEQDVLTRALAAIAHANPSAAFGEETAS
jgi:hypothetical protein